jgi:hypothetical protein
MDILNKSINTLSSQDIVEFCQKGYPEGVEFDYKKDYPEKGLEKLIAAFSNTRGGIILLGVEENKTTGVPTAWDGISDDAKIIERINQVASNISPMPRVEVHKTEPSAGKVFIIIRIMEGDKTPYYIHNDANIWARTGNVGKEIDISSPEWTELLIGKKEKAEKARNNYVAIAEDVYKYSLKKAEEERQHLIAEAKKKGDGSENNYYQKPLGTDSSMCTLILQPYYPREALTTPMDVSSKVNDYAVERGFHGRFPDYDLEAIPNGVMNFKHAHSGYIESQQIYANGLIYNSLDVLSMEKGTGQKIIYLSWVAGRLIAFLKTAGNFYRLFGYQGSLNGKISLNNLENSSFMQIFNNGYLYFDEYKESFLPAYSWILELDVKTLNDQEAFLKYYLSLLRKIYWDLGFKTMDDSVISKFLEQNKLL